jgi:hypothetical protein
MSISKVRFWSAFALLIAVVMLTSLAVPGASANDTFEVTVYHQINGKSAGAILFDDPKALPKALPVDVYVNGGLAFEDLKFGKMEKATLPAGEYTFTVNLANTNTQIMSFGPAEIPAGAEVVVRAKLINQTPTLAVKVK